jgi:hypothetical protein
MDPVEGVRGGLEEDLVFVDDIVNGDLRRQASSTSHRHTYCSRCSVEGVLGGLERGFVFVGDIMRAAGLAGSVFVGK